MAVTACSATMARTGYLEAVTTTSSTVVRTTILSLVTLAKTVYEATRAPTESPGLSELTLFLVETVTITSMEALMPTPSTDKKETIESWEGTGNDRLRGQEGDDVISDESGDDVLIGDDGDDSLNAGPGDDIIEAGEGMNRIWGGSGDDQIHSGADDDRIFAGDGDDQVFSGAGNDFIKGEAGNDRLFAHFGAGGQNRLFGGPGNDSLSASSDDVLMGEEGADRFLDVTNGGGYYHSDEQPEDVRIEFDWAYDLTDEHFAVIDDVFENLVNATGNNRLLQTPADPSEGITLRYTSFLDGKLADFVHPHAASWIYITEWDATSRRSGRINNFFKRQLTAEIGKIWSQESSLVDADPGFAGRAAEFLAVSDWQSSYATDEGNLTLNGLWRYDPTTHFFDERGQLSPLDDFGTAWSHYLNDFDGQFDGTESHDAKLRWVEQLITDLS